MYKCLMRVRTSDGVVHQPGDVIQLTEQEAKNCLSARAVQLVPDAQVKSAAVPTTNTPTVETAKPAVPATAQQQTPNPPVHNVTPKDGEV